MLLGSLGSRAAVTGGAQHQIYQGIAAAGIHRSLITGRSGSASVIIQYREYAHGVGSRQVGGQGGHPIRFWPHLDTAVPPRLLSAFTYRCRVRRQHRPAGCDPKLPRRLPVRLGQHLLLDLRGVLIRQIRGLRVQDFGPSTG
jgi:hypothetical protein